MGFLMLPHPLTNFNGAYSRNNLPKKKGWEIRNTP